MNSNIVISGSGLSSLIIAKLLSKRYPKANIHLIEKENVIGGQFGSVNYGDNQIFDFGMHIYYESCISEIDELFYETLTMNEWNVLEGNLKDAAGLFYNNKLQTLTPYIDLRNFSEEKKNEYLCEIFKNIEINKGKNEPENTNAFEIMKHRFGEKICKEIFSPIFYKLYRTNLENLDGIATRLTTINRLALFSEDLMLDFNKSDLIRERLCFPNQYTMPNYRNSNQRGFYPKKFGMFAVLERIKFDLENKGVKFYLSTSVSDIEIKKNRIHSVYLTNGYKIENVESLLWTAGLPPLANLLKINLTGLNYDKQKSKAYYVNLTFNKNPEMDKLYYFYCFDEGFKTFRVTNYYNYCNDAASRGGFPICVEIWNNEEDSEDLDSIINNTLKELKQFGIINCEYEVLFSKAAPVLGAGFPLPSCNNINFMNSIRDKILEENISNLIPMGVYSSPNVFFIKDVLTDSLSKINHFYKNK
jgi:protoporphyrinogen oxidase